MKRIMVLTIALLCAGYLAACEDDSSTAAEDLGIQEGRRPVRETPRRPPGPPSGELVADESASTGQGQDEPESDEPDEPDEP